VRIAAYGCTMTVQQPKQAFWLCMRQRDDAPDCHGKEGVAGSSPAEGSKERPGFAAFPGPGGSGLRARWLRRPLLGRVREVSGFTEGVRSSADTARVERAERSTCPRPGSPVAAPKP
jgi:hypothetical protein